jgi:hypothetical protein
MLSVKTDDRERFMISIPFLIRTTAACTVARARC